MAPLNRPREPGMSDKFRRLLISFASTKNPVGGYVIMPSAQMGNSKIARKVPAAGTEYGSEGVDCL